MINSVIKRRKQEMDAVLKEPCTARDLMDMFGVSKHTILADMRYVMSVNCKVGCITELGKYIYGSRDVLSERRKSINANKLGFKSKFIYEFPSKVMSKDELIDYAIRHMSNTVSCKNVFDIAARNGVRVLEREKIHYEY